MISRAELIAQLQGQAGQAGSGPEWDILIIGGGITGAGILLEAARRGWRCLLLEQKDFAWGTSSRSSKLVHGGLRYLKEGKFGLTAESVREREALLRDARGLVDPQSFAFADYVGKKPGRWLFALGLFLYDMMQGQRQRHYHSKDEFNWLAPHLGQTDLKGGLCYADAKTDDARLVLRVLQEAQGLGAHALNYFPVQNLLRNSNGSNDSNGQVCGVQALDSLQADLGLTIRARLVINATGAWVDRLRAPQALQPGKKIRPLRGSHLIFPVWRLPLAQAVSLMHPQDGRPVFAYPWEGVTLVGTTDVDHGSDLNTEAAITSQEAEYLMAALHAQFPQLNLQLTDAISSYAGVRPVVDSGAVDPSKEGRDHVVWQEDGMLSVTGGKLTTFRAIAIDALQHAQALLPPAKQVSSDSIFAPVTPLRWRRELSPVQLQRLAGRYGRHAQDLLDQADAKDLQSIAHTDYLWAELRWMLRHEAVHKLEDLMLRRSRLGLLLKDGGRELMPRLQALCCASREQGGLDWDEARWQREQSAYLQLWDKHYSVPVPAAKSAKPV